MFGKRLMGAFSIRSIPFLFLGFFIIAGQTAWAFDPFTVLATGNAIINLAELAGGGGKNAFELREIFSSLGELNDELVPSGNSGDSYRIARKIEEISHLALEAGYTKEEADSIVSGYQGSNESLSQSIRLLSRSIKLGKHVVGLVGLGGAGAVAASAGVMQGQIQEKKILTDIYGQMVSTELEQKKNEIENQKEIQTQYKKLRSYVLSIAPGKNISQFPVKGSLIEKAIHVYKAYYWIILSLVGAIFLGRIVYYQFSLAPAEKYADLIRDVFTCYFLMLAFPHVFSTMAECSEALSLKLSQILHVTGPEIPDLLPIEKGKIFWWFRIEVFPLILYAFTHVIFNLVVSVLIAIGPIVILSGTMLNFSVSISAYFALLLFVWLWPAFWNVLGYFKNMLWMDHRDVGSVITAFILFLFQLLSPLVVFSILKRTHAGGVASGTAKKVKSIMTGLAAGAITGGGVGGAVAGAGISVGKFAKAKIKSAISSPITTTRLVMARHNRKRQKSHGTQLGLQLGKKQYQL